MLSTSLIFLVGISKTKLPTVIEFVMIIMISTTLHALSKTLSPMFLDCIINTIMLTKLNIPQIAITVLAVAVA